MKKYIAIWVFLLACQAGYCQKYNVDQLFSEFANIENSDNVNLGQLTMAFAGMFTETMGVNGIEVYALDKCSNDVKEKLKNAIRNLKDSRYETVVTSNEKDGRTKVLMKMKDDVILELIVLTTGKTTALVRIKGKINPSDIERVTKKHGKSGC